MVREPEAAAPAATWGRANQWGGNHSRPMTRPDPVTINGTGSRQHVHNSGRFRGRRFKAPPVDVVAIATGGGNVVSITGTAGGTGASDSGDGVVVSSSTVTAGGGGTVTINRTAEMASYTGNNWGVYVALKHRDFFEGGNVSVTGTGGARPRRRVEHRHVEVDFGTITAGPVPRQPPPSRAPPGRAGNGVQRQLGCVH